MIRHILINALIILTLSGFGARAFAHGDPIICDVNGDIVEQCGQVHDCLIDPSVSDEIGVCEGEFEEESFTVCDRRREAETCPEGQVCRIGNLDPNIGACVVDPFAGFNTGDMEEAPDEETPDDDEPRCAALITSPAPSHSVAILLFGVILLAGTRRMTRRS